MDIEGWRYYRHAALPTCAPHEQPNMIPVQNGTIWRLGGGISMLARWTSDYDCEPTEWWYTIKDTPFHLADLKAKRRYEINKGKKNFNVQVIDPAKYVEEILKVEKKALSAWPEKYRPKITTERAVDRIKGWKSYGVYGAFDRSNNLCGYAYLRLHDTYAEFSVLRACPEAEKLAINAAIISAIVTDFNEKIERGYYICDGERAIFHETRFQDYLEKYFGFRKAYCKLHIKYRFPLNILIWFFYPIRRRIKGEGRVFSRLKALLSMEEIHKKCS